MTGSACEAGILKLARESDCTVMMPLQLPPELPQFPPEGLTLSQVIISQYCPAGSPVVSHISIFADASLLMTMNPVLPRPKAII